MNLLRHNILGALCLSPTAAIAQRLRRAWSEILPHSDADRSPFPSLPGFAEHHLELGKDRRALMCGYLVGQMRDIGGIAVPEGVEQIVDCALSDAPQRIASRDGPYLIAAIDSRVQTGLLVRDNFGLRPLYYSKEGGCLWFADDIRLLLSLLGGRQIRKQGLLEWCHYGLPLEPLTLFEGVRSLRPGSLLRYDLESEEIEVEGFYSPQSSVSADRHRMLRGASEEDIERQLEEELDRAVARACAGRSAVSVLMSGGVDSSMIAALARRHTKVVGVTVDLYGPGAVSEVRWATAVAEHLGIELRICRFGPEEFRQTLPDAVASLGTPIIVENSVALYYAGKEGSLPFGQLILDGEGADALFGGSTDLFANSMYTYLLGRVSRLGSDRIRRVFRTGRGILAKLGLSTRSTVDGFGVDVNLGARRLEIQQLTDDLMEVLAHESDQSTREIAALMLREFYDYLVPLMLRINAMSAAAGSHSVLPYLDSSCFTFCTNIPVSHKFRWRWSRSPAVTKYPLKKLLAKHVPRSVVHRPKVGFGIPGGRWLAQAETPWSDTRWLAKTFELDPDLVTRWTRSCTTRDRLFLETMELFGRSFGG
jgi:asparagine synthase (glutamine-hydrolysing)